MIPSRTCFAGLGGALVLAALLSRHFIIFIWTSTQPRAAQSAKLLALQSELAACKDRIDRKLSPKPRFDPAFRLLWVLLSKLLDGWEGLSHLMQPATVKRLHTAVFRTYWRRRSEPGRPPISQDMQTLIRRLSRENPLWSADPRHPGPAGIRCSLHGYGCQVHAQTPKTATILLDPDELST